MQLSRSKISTKYQIVIPREIRKLIKIKPGKTVYFLPSDESSLVIMIKQDSNWVSSAKGIAQNAYSKNSTKWLKNLRKNWKNYKYSD